MRVRGLRDDRRRSGRAALTSPGHRLGRILTLAVLTLAVFPSVAGAAAPGRAVTARADDVTASLNNLRTGWDPSEPALSPAVVGGGTFGRLFSTAVRGQVYAQPLVVGSTLIVATEDDWVYGLNAATGAVRWSRSVGTPYRMTWCTDLEPNIGVTAAPVYDPANGDVYLVAQRMEPTVYPGVGETHYLRPEYYLMGLNAQSGQVVMKRKIAGSPSNDPSLAFDAKYENARAGLLLMNGWVYTAFAAHCDQKPYAGFVAGVNVSTGTETLWTDESGVTDDQAGIWQSGGGLMSDGAGRIFLSSGNGVSPPPGPGTSPPGQLGDSTVRLAVQPDGTLVAKDFFSPSNAPALDAADADFGSGGPVGLPFGTSAYPDVLVQAGKDGRIFLLNRGRLGGREQGAGGTDAVLGMAGPYPGQWGHPAVFADTPVLTPANAGAASDFLYYVGKEGFLRAFRFGVASSGAPAMNMVAASTFAFGYTSGSPLVTSSGTDPSSAVVWVVRSGGASGAGATLDAFRAVPPSSCTSATPCTMSPLWSSPIGAASKFAIPATSNGRVYVGTRDGHVLGFGVITGSALRGAHPQAFGATPVGSTTVRHVTVRASRRVTVSRVRVATSVAGAATVTSREFRVRRVTETSRRGRRHRVRFPVRLHRGDKLHVTAAFTPAVPGGAAGVVRFVARSHGRQRVTVPLSGTGTRAGLYATSAALSFRLVLNDGQTVSGVPAGLTVPRMVNIVNGGTTPQTVAAVSRPGGPFTVSGPLAPGTVIRPGQAVSVQVAFTPRGGGPASGSFTLTSTGGEKVTVRLSGTGQRPLSGFSASRSVVNFGAVPVGHTASEWVDVTNTGNETATMASASAPSGPFSAPYRVAVGLPVNSGYDLRIPIRFTPARTGTFTGTYQITWTDVLGTHTLRIALSGTGTG